MKTIRPELQARLDAGTTTLTHCVRIVRVDGATLYFTNLDADISMGGNLYQSGAGYTPTAVSQNSEPRSDTIDVEGILEALGVNRSDIAAGLFDNARIYVFATDYLDPVEDDIKLMTGFWGKVKLDQGRFITEFTSLSDRLNQASGRTIKPSCDTDLGSTRCGINLNPDTWAALTAYTEREPGDARIGSIIKPSVENGLLYICSTEGTSDALEPVWNTSIDGTTNDGSVVWTGIRAYALSGTVDSSANKSQINDGDRTEPDEWWLGGTVTFNTGLNAGLSMDIKASTAIGVITLFQHMPFYITPGDTYTINVGCRHRHIADCKEKFDNVRNFQGFPYAPSSDDAYKFGGQ